MQWKQNLGRDRVLGIVLPPGWKRDFDSTNIYLNTDKLLFSAPDSIRVAAADACTVLKTRWAEDDLKKLLADKSATGAARSSALRALAAIQLPSFDKAIELALASNDKTLMQAARQLVSKTSPDPNAVIAPGFDNVLVTLNNGDMVAGLLNAEDANEVTLASLVDGKKQKVKKADIKERTTVPSAMPPGLGDVLGKRGLRDVIEYLSTGQ